MTDPTRHLLLVEDEAPLRQAIAEQLGSRGYQVDQAGSGEDAIAKLARSRESQGITFAEVARRMGRTYLQQVFNWLNGGMECRARRLFALADALGYDLALIPREDA